MNAYSTNSPNPYAKRYLTKGRRSLDNKYMDSWPSTKRMKKDPIQTVHLDQDSSHNKSETYNFLGEDNYIQNDYQELYDSGLEFERIHDSSSENYTYMNENDNHNIVDENSVFIDGSNEEYSIDFIDETDSSLMDNFSYNQYSEPLYNTCFLDSNLTSQPRKDKRKQGIVGRPTLSSPQRLLVPDNVYSRGNPCIENDNYFTDNNYRNRQPTIISVTKHYPIKKSVKHETMDYDESLQRNACRNRPRILSKPTLPEYRPISNSQIFFNTSEQDALEIAQRTVANREFARNLVKRAERQGTVIDKNKIPMSVFEQQPVEVLMKSALDEQLSAGIAEIKETEQIVVSQPYSNTVNASDPRKVPIIIKKPILNLPKPPQMTASDILKLKWKAASRQQS